MKSPLEIMEEATADVARNLFNMRYPEGNPLEMKKQMDECVSDTVFVINNFMRISANIAKENENVE
jgi:hypothetical protein